MGSSFPSWYHFYFFVTLILGLTTTGCLVNNDSTSQSQTLSPAATQCSDESVVIQVGDGFFMILCGCTRIDEKPGTVFSALGGHLTCHTAQSKAVVFFNFTGAVLPKRIAFSESSGIGASWVFNPSDASSPKVYSVTLTQPSVTYDFQEVYSNMTGQIIMPE